MQVKNISGVTKQFVFGARPADLVSVTLAHNATGTVSDRNDVVASAFEFVRQNLLEIVTPPLMPQLNLAVPRLVSVTLKDAVNSAVVTIGGIAITTGPTASSVAQLGTAFTAAVNAEPNLQRLGVIARDYFLSGSDAVVLLEVPAGLLPTTSDAVNAAVAVVQATPVAAEAVQMFCAARVAAGTALTIPTGLRNILYFDYQVRRAGVLTSVTSVVTSPGGLIVFTNAGGTPLAASDVVTVVAYGTL